jgi:hypothetical protein
MVEASASSAASATSGIRTALRPQLQARISFSGMDRHPKPDKGFKNKAMIML